MITLLGNLVEHSIFTLNSVKYKVSTRAREPKKNLNPRHTFLEEYTDNTIVIECYPFLGGQWQIHLSVFVNEKQEVEIQ